MHPDPDPSPSAWTLRGRTATTGLGPVPTSAGTEGLWKGAFPVTQQPLPSRLHGSELCNAAHTARLLCVNPINISWSCFLQGKDCYQLWLSAAPTSALLAENIRFPSTGGQHPTAPPFPPLSALEISLCLLGALYATRGKSCEVLSGSNLTISCPRSLKPAHSRCAQRYGPVLGSPGPSCRPCSSGMGDQTHPRSLWVLKLRVRQRNGEGGPVRACCRQPRPRLAGSHPPCPAASSPRVPARPRAQREPGGEVGCLQEEKSCFLNAKTALF